MALARRCVGLGHEFAYEPLVDAALGDAVGAVAVDDLAGELSVPGQGVYVEYELVAVPGLLLAGLEVDDEKVVSAQDQEVRLAGEGGGMSAEAEGVLVLDADLVAAPDPELVMLVEGSRVASGRLVSFTLWL